MSKIIAIKEDTITILLDDDTQKDFDKSIFKFKYKIGDKVFIKNDGVKITIKKYESVVSTKKVISFVPILVFLYMIVHLYQNHHLDKFIQYGKEKLGISTTEQKVKTEEELQEYRENLRSIRESVNSDTFPNKNNDVDNCVLAADKDDFKNIINYCQKICNSNDEGFGCYAFGNLYDEEDNLIKLREKRKLGINIDKLKAAKFYEKACDLNSAIGCVSLTTFYLKDKAGLEKANILASKACKLDESSCFYKAALLLNEKSSKIKSENIMNLLSKSCNSKRTKFNHQLSELGCLYLGKIYSNESNLNIGKTDYLKAKSFFEKSCYSNYFISESCSHLGLMYVESKGVKQDIEKAKKLFLRSCDNDFPDASGCYYLGSILDLEKDYSNARKFYQKVCDLGNQQGCDEYKKLNK